MALLPGSRRQEIERILPPMLEAAREIRRRFPEAAFLIPAASPEIRECIDGLLAARTAEERRGVVVVDGQMREVARQARAAMVCSGTATIETALLKCPMIVVYRMSRLTYWFGRRVIRVPWLGMVNLIARRTVCPEFIQDDARPESMARAVESLLDETTARREQLDGLAEVVSALQGGEQIKTAGQVVAEALG